VMTVLEDTRARVVGRELALILAAVG
jgi:hypothetical protein